MLGLFHLLYITQRADVARNGHIYYVLLMNEEETLEPAVDDDEEGAFEAIFTEYGRTFDDISIVLNRTCETAQKLLDRYSGK